VGAVSACIPLFFKRGDRDQGISAKKPIAAERRSHRQSNLKEL
jgi:hypothetical protein